MLIFIPALQEPSNQLASYISIMKLTQAVLQLLDLIHCLVSTLTKDFLEIFQGIAKFLELDTLRAWS
jgi:hypothetical protein